MSDSENDHGSYVKIEAPESEYVPSDDEDEAVPAAKKRTLDEDLVTTNGDDTGDSKQAAIEKTSEDEIMTTKNHMPDTSLNAQTPIDSNAGDEGLPDGNVEDGMVKRFCGRILEWMRSLALLAKEHRRIVIIFLLVVFLGILVFFGLNFYVVVKNYQECKLERDSLLQTLEALQSGEIKVSQLPQINEGKSILRTEDLYIGKCKKMKFRTLERLFGLKPGNLVICI